MKIVSTNFLGLKTIKLNKIYDLRGVFVKIFEKKNFFSSFYEKIKNHNLKTNINYFFGVFFESWAFFISLIKF